MLVGAHPNYFNARHLLGAHGRSLFCTFAHWPFAFCGSVCVYGVDRKLPVSYNPFLEEGWEQNLGNLKADSHNYKLQKKGEGNTNAAALPTAPKRNTLGVPCAFLFGMK